jgi:hypothetical protein
MNYIISSILHAETDAPWEIFFQPIFFWPYVVMVYKIDYC